MMTNDEAIIAVKEVTGMSLPWDDRHYEALQMAIEALQYQKDEEQFWSEQFQDEDSSEVPNSSDMISRKAVLERLTAMKYDGHYYSGEEAIDTIKTLVAVMPSVHLNTDRIYAELSKVYNMDGLPDEAIGIVGDLMLSLDEPSAGPERKKGQWIPVEERLPDGTYPVIVTWKNDDPASYYQYVLGKHYAGVAHYKSGKWFWYSSVTEDVLMEYGRCDSEEFDEAIKVLAWMPLPSPYQEGEQDGNTN